MALRHHTQWVSFDLTPQQIVRAVGYWSVVHPSGDQVLRQHLTEQDFTDAVHWSLNHGGTSVLTTPIQDTAATRKRMVQVIEQISNLVPEWRNHLMDTRPSPSPQDRRTGITDAAQLELDAELCVAFATFLRERAESLGNMSRREVNREADPEGRNASRKKMRIAHLNGAADRIEQMHGAVVMIEQPR